MIGHRHTVLLIHQHQHDLGETIASHKSLTPANSGAKMINHTRRTRVRTTENRWPAATGIATGRMSD